MINEVGSGKTKVLRRLIWTSIYISVALARGSEDSNAQSGHCWEGHLRTLKLLFGSLRRVGSQPDLRIACKEIGWSC